jgi:hypothetical protein
MQGTIAAASRVPGPPGTRRTSRGGAVANVWVGRICCVKLPEEVRMGVRVGAMRERVSGSDSERRLRASRGPKTSRAWKCGKRRTPMEREVGAGRV